MARWSGVAARISLWGGRAPKGPLLLPLSSGVLRGSRIVSLLVSINRRRRAESLRCSFFLGLGCFEEGFCAEGVSGDVGVQIPPGESPMGPVDPAIGDAVLLCEGPHLEDWDAEVLRCLLQIENFLWVHPLHRTGTPF